MNAQAVGIVTVLKTFPVKQKQQKAKGEQRAPFSLIFARMTQGLGNWLYVIILGLVGWLAGCRPGWVAGWLASERPDLRRAALERLRLDDVVGEHALVGQGRDRVAVPGHGLHSVVVQAPVDRSTQSVGALPLEAPLGVRVGEIDLMIPRERANEREGASVLGVELELGPIGPVT